MKEIAFPIEKAIFFDKKMLMASARTNRADKLCTKIRKRDCDIQSQVDFFSFFTWSLKMDKPSPPPLTPIQKHVNEAITKLRLEKKCSIQKLADYIKADRSHVAHIESANKQNKSYSLAQMNAAAFYLGANIHDLLPKEPLEPEGS